MLKSDTKLTKVHFKEHRSKQRSKNFIIISFE